MSSSTEQRLALQAYVLEAMRALDDCEKKLLTALGHAVTLAGEERGDSAKDLLENHVAALRDASRELSEWLDGPSPAP